MGKVRRKVDRADSAEANSCNGMRLLKEEEPGYLNECDVGNKPRSDKDGPSLDEKKPSQGKISLLVGLLLMPLYLTRTTPLTLLYRLLPTVMCQLPAAR
ncbi:hypothetical protein VM1G_05727 [Cytospora mali]|uniref:Uncharacterized protein n=1 Tax=Cytospora mali TaxID=578113 RepID=A0A194W3E4_CYTMA|nr:hypothetical protein VM1G_05727 [Valsa mali]